MRFEILQENLMKVLSIVSPVIGGKSDPEQTHGILLSVQDRLLTATATNLAVTISATTLAKVHEEGEVLTSGVDFMHQIDALNPAIPVEVKTTNKSVTVTAGDARTEMPTRNAEDFPSPPKLQDEPVCMVFAHELRSAIQRVSATCLRDKFESRPALAGIEVDVSETGLVMFSFDGSGSASASTIPAQTTMGAEAKLDMNIREDGFKPLVSALAKHDPKDEVFIYRGMKGRHVGFKSGGIEYITTGQEQRFANIGVLAAIHKYRDEAKTFVTIDRRPLLSVLKLARVTNPMVRIRITEDGVALAATGEGGKKHNNSFGNCITDGPDLNIAFNADMMVEALALMDCKSVTLAFIAHNSTFVVYDTKREMPWVFSQAPLLI